jgi:hypothetical protein
MKTSELTGHALNWAVAKCEGVELYSGPRDKNPAYKANWVRRKHGGLYQPSTDWAQGGPIIEREGISTVREGDARNWVASVYNYAEDDWHLHTEGTTPLIAAMRCYVASKLGDEVEIPKELTT